MQKLPTHLPIYEFFREFIQSFLSPQTQRAYTRDLFDYFYFCQQQGYQIQHPQHIDSQHCLYYRDTLIQSGRSAATVNRKLVAVRSFVKWSMAKGLMRFNPFDSIKLPKASNVKSTVAFDDEEVLAMLEAPDVSQFKGNWHRLGLCLFFYLGLRRSELAQIKLMHIQEERHHLVLNVQGKGDKIRALPLPPKVQDEIMQYLDRYQALTGQSLDPQDFLLQSRPHQKNSKPIDGSTLYRLITQTAKKLGIQKPVGPHSCRATAISHLLDTQMIPLRDVAVFAGHAKVTTTERYDKKRKGLDQNPVYKIKY